MGILFATIVMTVSSVIHNNNLSDEEIIKRASKLGMVMENTESEEGLFGSKNDSENESEIPSQKPESQKPETQEPESQKPESQEPETQEPESQEPVTQEPDTQTPPQHVEITQYVLHINLNDKLRLIAQELYENGMIEDASDFRSYVEDNGYAGKIRTGTYTITKGMTYEEITKLITKS